MEPESLLAQRICYLYRADEGIRTPVILLTTKVRSLSATSACIASIAGESAPCHPAQFSD